MSEIIDISLPISQTMLTWPGDPPVQIVGSRRIARGDAANVSELVMGSHTGTHVDPPLHFIDGAGGIDTVPLDVLVGPATVADLTGARDQITANDLADAVGDPPPDRILLKTANSGIWGAERAEFPASYVALDPSGAEWAARSGVRLIGTDFLSIEKRGSPGHPTHVALLSAGIAIVEGLDLRAVVPGVYTLFCLPLRIAGGDGAPARAILMK